jgi:DNA-directed RNA polymerase subunit RPC12/RpoP
MLTIRCAKCGKRIFKYEKIGQGRLLHCWKDQIVEDRSVREGREVRCQCGSLVGLDEGKWIKMKRNSFARSGTVSNR